MLRQMPHDLAPQAKRAKDLAKEYAEYDGPYTGDQNDVDQLLPSFGSELFLQNQHK